MSKAATTAISLSSDFYLNSYYRDNRSAKKSSGRNELTSTELSYEDSRALRRAVKHLESFSFSEDDNIENVRNSISAFIDTYNNALTSSGADESGDIKRYAKQLKRLASKYTDELEDLGISMDSKKGTLSVNKNLFSKQKLDEIKKVFSKDNTDLLKSTQKIARQLGSNSYNELYTQLTGNGGKINISL